MQRNDIAIERASNMGITAAVRGIPYGQNPYTQHHQQREKLAWSQAHNGMRARMALDGMKAQPLA